METSENEDVNCWSRQELCTVIKERSRQYTSQIWRCLSQNIRAGGSGHAEGHLWHTVSFCCFLFTFFVSLDRQGQEVMDVSMTDSGGSCTGYKHCRIDTILIFRIK